MRKTWWGITTLDVQSSHHSTCRLPSPFTIQPIYIYKSTNSTNDKSHRAGNGKTMSKRVKNVQHELNLPVLQLMHCTVSATQTHANCSSFHKTSSQPVRGCFLSFQITSTKRLHFQKNYICAQLKEISGLNLSDKIIHVWNCSNLAPIIWFEADQSRFTLESLAMNKFTQTQQLSQDINVGVSWRPLLV